MNNMNYWNTKGAPHKGWINMGCEDLGEATHKCKMCGKEEIRYVHTMYHPEVEDYFLVGEICASKMTNDYNTPKEQLKQMKKKTTWKTTNWKKIDCHQYEEKSFNSTYGRAVVGIFECNGKYRFHLDNYLFSIESDSKQEIKDFIYDRFVLGNK